PVRARRQVRVAAPGAGVAAVHRDLLHVRPCLAVVRGLEQRRVVLERGRVLAHDGLHEAGRARLPQRAVRRKKEGGFLGVEGRVHQGRREGEGRWRGRWRDDRGGLGCGFLRATCKKGQDENGGKPETQQAHGRATTQPRFLACGGGARG